MGNFNRDDRSGGRGGGGFRGRDRGGKNFGGDRGERSMHKAICSQCKKECEVPFRPSGDRPVFCSDCFRAGAQKQGGGGHERQHFGEKQMFQATCVKCGNKCEVPFRPTGERPVYCGQCFGKGGDVPVRSQSSDQYREQLIMVNAKLDKILKILNPQVVPAAPQETKASEKTKEIKEGKGVVAKAKAVLKKAKTKAKK